MKRIHFIAVGGAIMHNLALALAAKGHTVTGSDDAIYDPALSNLIKAGLQPSIGWDAEQITEDIDIIILGMHARLDNVELKKAQDLGLKIMSFPEYVAEECKDKIRIVVAGSHGKTTTTAMIMHVLRELKFDFDYLVGSSIDGFDLSVKLSDAPWVIIEGDEYLSSPLDMRSKFLWYSPHISIITGIAYDHINVFPTFDLYLETFKKYIETHTSGGTYFWYAGDEYLKTFSQNTRVANHSYDTPEYENHQAHTTLIHDGERYELEIVGKHNLQNLKAAQLACEKLGISAHDFYTAAGSFTGAGRRMEKIVDKPSQVVYRDFAHSPSKLKATTEAVKETYGGELLAVFELHTFSSLNKDFLPLYRDTVEQADRAIVFYNSAVFEHKKMEYISEEYVQECFGNVQILHDPRDLSILVDEAYLSGQHILLMSSGKFENAKFNFD